MIIFLILHCHNARYGDPSWRQHGNHIYTPYNSGILLEKERSGLNINSLAQKIISSSNTTTSHLVTSSSPCRWEAYQTRSNQDPKIIPRSSSSMDFKLSTPCPRERSSSSNSLKPFNGNIDHNRHPITPQFKQKLALDLDLSLALASKHEDDHAKKKSSAKDKGLDSELSLSLQYPPLSSSSDNKLTSKSKRREYDSNSRKLARTSLDLSL